MKSPSNEMDKDTEAHREGRQEIVCLGTCCVWDVYQIARCLEISTRQLGERVWNSEDADMNGVWRKTKKSAFRGLLGADGWRLPCWRSPDLKFFTWRSSKEKSPWILTLGVLRLVDSNGNMLTTKSYIAQNWKMWVKTGNKSPERRKSELAVFILYFVITLLNGGWAHTPPQQQAHLPPLDSPPHLPAALTSPVLHLSEWSTGSTTQDSGILTYSLRWKIPKTPG